MLKFINKGGKWHSKLYKMKNSPNLLNSNLMVLKLKVPTDRQNIHKQNPLTYLQKEHKKWPVRCTILYFSPPTWLILIVWKRSNKTLNNIFSHEADLFHKSSYKEWLFWHRIFRKHGGSLECHKVYSQLNNCCKRALGVSMLQTVVFIITESAAEVLLTKFPVVYTYR